MTFEHLAALVALALHVAHLILSLTLGVINLRLGRVKERVRAALGAAELPISVVALLLEFVHAMLASPR